jgi:tetratricopeptide (TPR) repeat protein
MTREMKNSRSGKAGDLNPAGYFDTIGPKLSVGLIFLLGILVYSNTFHSSFHFDDFSSIVNNKSIRKLWNLEDIWRSTPTRVFSYWTFALNYHWNGLDVVGFHVMNIGIHILSGIFLWWLIRLLLSTPAMKETSAFRRRDVLSLAGALLFVVHPVQTQAVTYIVQRIASLATLFYLVSLCCYVCARIKKVKRAQRLVFYLLSFIFTLLAMLSKETAYTLPLAIVLIELFFMKGKFKIRTFLIFIGAGGSIVLPLLFYFGRKLPTAETTTISRIEYLMTQFTVIPIYLKLLVVPAGQNLDYDIAVVRSMADPSALLGLALIVALVAVGVLLYTRHRLISFGFFLFFLALLPESSIIPIRDVIFEHRLYLPMIGFVCIVIGFINVLYRTQMKRFIPLGLLLLFGVYSITAYARNTVWKGDFVLWDDCVQKSPRKARPYLNRGIAYTERGMNNEASKDYEYVLHIDPRNGRALNNLANIYVARGEYDKAIANYARALEIWLPDGEPYDEVYFSRATAYGQKGMYEKAIRDLDRYISTETDFAPAYCNRGVAKSNIGKYQEAIEDFTIALMKDQNYGEAYSDRGFVFQQMGKYEEAFKDYGEAIRLGNHVLEASINRGAILINNKNYDAAIVEYTRALELSANSPLALNGRGFAWYMKGDFRRALNDLSKAIQIDSGYALAYQNRGMVYRAMGDGARAREDFEMVRKLNK